MLTAFFRTCSTKNLVQSYQIITDYYYRGTEIIWYYRNPQIYLRDS